MKQLFVFCNKFNYISIYGIGKIAIELAQKLKQKDINIISFLVSDGENIPEEFIENIPVMNLSEYISAYHNDNVGILIAVSNRYRKEIVQNLELEEINQYLSVSEIMIQELTRSIKKIDFQLKNIKPVSSVFGLDRGTPIDRYYIEKFLSEMCRKIENIENVIEVADNTYSKKFFNDKATTLDILTYDKDKRMDLTKLKSLPKEKYDVFICTQVFNFIYNLKSAIEGSKYILKENGILMATVAGNISPVSLYDRERWGDYWRFTEMGIQKLMEEVFGVGNVEVYSYGNALSATAFVQGMAVEDIENSILLDESDLAYSIVIGIVAQNIRR